MPDPKRRYSEDEVRSILDRALRHGPDAARGIAHDELVAAASVVGVTQAELEAAIRASEEHRAEAELRDAVLERRRRGFREEAEKRARSEKLEKREGAAWHAHERRGDV
jgi:hypothetical protein